MADGHLALERPQLLLVEHLADESLVTDGHDVAVLRRGYAGRFLAPMLQGEQREVAQAGDVMPWRVHAEDATLIARTIAEVSQVVQGGVLPGTRSPGGPAREP